MSRVDLGAVSATMRCATREVGGLPDATWEHLDPRGLMMKPDSFKSP